MASTLRAGIGAWYDDQRVEVLTKALGTLQPSIDLQQRLLSAYGYKIEATGIEDTSHSWRLERFKCISGQVITQAFLTRKRSPIDLSP